MKRHHVLQPLSREHHTALIAAQLLKEDTPDYEGLPSTPTGKRDYFLDVFSSELLPHFNKEEQIIAVLSDVPEALEAMHRRVLDEHALIMRLAEKLTIEEVSAGLLHETGTLIASHVRFEERQWFPSLQAWIVERGYEQKIAGLTGAE